MLLFVCFGIASFAQQQSVSNMDSVSLHYEKMAVPFLCNGFEYVRYDTHIQNALHPYFREPDYARGAIWYQGRHFDDQPMLLDIVQDYLIIPDHFGPGRYGQIVLLPQRLDSFYLRGMQFIHLQDSTRYRPGFYARLHAGSKGTLYARYQKHFEKGVITPDGVWDIITDGTYYEWQSTGGNFERLSTQADMARVLQQKRSRIKRYLRSQGINDFRHNKEAAMTAAFRQFDPQ